MLLSGQTMTHGGALRFFMETKSKQVPTVQADFGTHFACDYD